LRTSKSSFSRFGRSGEIRGSYHQYWYNEDAGTLFCLMEGPDAESCAATHLEAHGLSACQIVEVEGGMYEKFMGRDHKLDHGLVRRPDGEIDSGYRYIFTLNIIARTKLSDTVNIHQLKLPTIPIKTALSIIEKHGGKEVGTAGYDCIIAVFKDAVNSLDCAHEVQQEYLKSREIPGGDDFTFNMGISIGQPLTGTDGFLPGL
jgi:hypothetical protein